MNSVHFMSAVRQNSTILSSNRRASFVLKREFTTAKGERGIASGLDMREAELKKLIASHDVIFSDVFDTILLRKPISERRRQYKAAELFVDAGHFGASAAVSRQACIDAVYWSRRKAQALAFRGLTAHGDKNEVRLSTVLAAQVALLGLGDAAKEGLRCAELEVEKSSLRLNASLISEYRAAVDAGANLYAVSDTMLDTASLTELIQHFVDPNIFTRIYSSADERKSKREGSLFGHILAQNGLNAEEVLHIGDDAHADGERARAVGFKSRLVPRRKDHRMRTKLDGAGFEISRRRGRAKDVGPIEDSYAFGKNVVGPIYAAFCVQLWLYLTTSQDHAEPVALFCARGGLAMRALYDTTLSQLGLTDMARSQDIMISRFVLAKSGLLRADPAVLREIEREHVGRRLDQVVSSFSEGEIALSEHWHRPYTVEAMQAFLASDDAAEFKTHLIEHDRLFRKHFADILGKSDRAVLVDTGLYGSIQLFLQNLMPDVDISSVLLARSNYKNFTDDHFPRVIGILSEKDTYDPLDNHTSILRYWQLIEEMFEPALSSVMGFKEVDGKVVADLQVPGWQQLVADHDHPVFLGAQAYLQTLGSGDLPRIVADERSAWKKFKRIVIYPTRAEAQYMSVGLRPRDFGLEGFASDTSNLAESWSLRFKHAHWKNAAVHTMFFLPAWSIQFGMEAVYFLRNLRKGVGASLGISKKTPPSA